MTPLPVRLDFTNPSNEKHAPFPTIHRQVPLRGVADHADLAVHRCVCSPVRLFTDPSVDHSTPHNVSKGGELHRKWQMGLRDCAAGHHALFDSLKRLSRPKDRRFAIATIT